MRVIGKRASGEIATYEVRGFRFNRSIEGVSNITCIVDISNSLIISGKEENITEEQSIEYAKEIFRTGLLDLIDAPVQLDLYAYNVPVSLNNIDGQYIGKGKYGIGQGLKVCEI